MIELSLLAQVIIWIVGIGIAIYIAVFQMFIGGLIEVITAIVDLSKETEDFEASVLVWGIAKVIFASLTGWFIMLITSLVATVAREYLE